MKKGLLQDGCFAISPSSIAFAIYFTFYSHSHQLRPRHTVGFLIWAPDHGLRWLDRAEAFASAVILWHWPAVTGQYYQALRPLGGKPDIALSRPS